MLNLELLRLIFSYPGITIMDVSLAKYLAPCPAGLPMTREEHSKILILQT